MNTKSCMCLSFVLLLASTSLALLPTTGTQGFLDAHGETRAMVHGERIVALYGNAFAASNGGESAPAFAQRFIDTDANALGVDDVDLRPVGSVFIKNGDVQVFEYRQFIGDLPVVSSVVKVPVVLGGGAIPHRIGFVAMDIKQHPAAPLAGDIKTEMEAKTAVSNLPEYAAYDFTAAEKVVLEDAFGQLHRVWHFAGIGPEDTLAFFVDTNTGALVSAIRAAYDVDVSGSVTGDHLRCCPYNSPSYPNCCSSDEESVEGPIPLQGVRLKVVAGDTPSCPSIEGSLLDESETDTAGDFSFAVSQADVRVQARTDGEWAYTVDCLEAGTLGCMFEWSIGSLNVSLEACAHADSSGVADIALTPETLDFLGMAHVTAFDAVQRTHDWFVGLVPGFTGINQRVPILVNEARPAANYEWELEIIRIGSGGALSGNLVWLTTATPAIVSHEYGHFILDQILQLRFGMNKNFHEGVADTVAALLWDTYYIGYGIHEIPPQFDFIRRFDSPNVTWQGGNLPPWCNNPTDEHCRGLALVGAFWDLRQSIGLAATRRIFADFLFVTDGVLDASVITEVLTADDDDGNLCNDSPNKQAIITAFGSHGWAWSNTACTGDGGVVVKWLGPPGPPTIEDGDYAVNTRLNPPHVILKTTSKGEPVTEWTVGRVVNGQPAPIGRLNAEWDNQIARNIIVHIGDDTDPDYTVGDVHLVDIAAQSSAHYSNIIFNMQGKCEGGDDHGQPCSHWSECDSEYCAGPGIPGRAQCFAVSDPESPNYGKGGRISGTIGGQAERIIAQAVGIGADDDVESTLTIGNVVSQLRLATLPARSVINLPSGFATELNIDGDLLGTISTPGPDYYQSTARRIAIGGDLLGRIEYTGAFVAGEILVAGDIKGDIDINGAEGAVYENAKIIANSDSFEGGSILGQVHVTGEFNGTICGANLDANQPLPLNINIEKFGPLANVCGISQENSANCETAAPEAPEAEFTVIKRNRFISFKPTNVGYEDPYAIRIFMESLHHPTGLIPQLTPDFSEFEGEWRYVNTFKNAQGIAVFDCPDSRNLGTTFKCATLGCEPEYRHWSEDFNDHLLHVTGPEIVPDSKYVVHLISSECWANVSPGLTIQTGRWGSVDNDSQSQVAATDLAMVVDAAKGTPGCLSKSRAKLEPEFIDPFAKDVGAMDIAYSVDGVKGNGYPFAIRSCASTVLCGSVPCLANEFPDVTLCEMGQTCIDGYCRDEAGRCAPQ